MDDLNIALYMGKLCKDKGFSVNATKIQKLLYILYGTLLAIDAENFIKEKPQFWPYGPVFPSILKKYKKEDCKLKEDEITSEDLKDIMKQVVDKFGHCSASSLSNWSHKFGSPWHNMQLLGKSWGATIPDEMIKGYFNDKIIKKGTSE